MYTLSTCLLWTLTCGFHGSGAANEALTGVKVPLRHDSHSAPCVHFPWKYLQTGSLRAKSRHLLFLYCCCTSYFSASAIHHINKINIYFIKTFNALNLCQEEKSPAISLLCLDGTKWCWSGCETTRLCGTHMGRWPCWRTWERLAYIGHSTV